MEGKKKAYIKKQREKTSELLKQEPKDRTERAIIDLELIINSIAPYSHWWRYGYIKSLKMAIAALQTLKTMEEK